MSPLVFGETEAVIEPRPRSLGAFLAAHGRRRGPVPGPDAPGNVFLVFDETAWLAFLRAARSDLTREQIGVLHGRPYTDGKLTWVHVRHALHAKAARGTPVRADLDAGAWDRLADEAARLGIDSDDDPIVGWWHTHPDLGAFFSGTDRHTQERAFRSPWHLGLVIDPIRGELALFSGPDSLDVVRQPLIVGPLRRPLGPLPALAVALDLPRDAADLGTAAWTALLEAPRGCRLHPLPPGRAGLVRAHPALLLDRPQLKRRYSAARAALTGPGSGPGGAFDVPLPLVPGDVHALLIDGHARPVADLFPGAPHP